MKQLLIVSSVLALATVAGAQSSDDVRRAAIGQMRKGRAAQAVQLLEDRLKTHAGDVDVRILLGRIHVWDGQPDKAVTCWKAGITDAAKPVKLYLAIGGVRQQQAKDGPNIVRRRGMMRASPSKDKAADEAWKRARAKEAVTILRAGLDAHPQDVRMVDGLSAAYIAAGDQAGAIAFLKTQATKYPNPTLALRLAKLLKEKPEEAVVWYRRAVDLDPRSGAAHKGLAAYHRQKGETQEAEQAEQRATFFRWLPPFAKVAFSAERYAQVKVLGGRRATEEQVALVTKLGASKDRDDLEMLAGLIFHHPHNRVEDKAFELLGSRAAAGPLLIALFDRGESQCTKRGAARAMARAKAVGAYERLVRALPGDMRSTWNMDIAGALALLGDVRAVPHLVRLLEPARREPKPKGFSFSSRKYARQRAALALGAFGLPASKQALEAGVNNPDIDLACQVALYRLAPTPERLTALRTVTLADPGRTYLIIDYLAEHTDAGGKALAKDLRAALEKKRTEKKKKKKKQR